MIKVPDLTILPCDMILLSGNVIMNEAMLTGESVPVIKASLPNVADETFNPKTHSKYMLSGGTGVVQTRPVGDKPCTAVVTNTGFLTLKGGLVRDILYPKQFYYNFYNESLKFCCILGSFAFVGLCYIVPIMVQNEEEDTTIIDRALNLFAIAVPPALPAAVGAGVIFAQKRLKD